MKDQHNGPLGLEQLRARAEEQLRRSSAASLEEHRVQQIELELQNEELQHTHRQLVAAYERYRALYRNAPVAYLVVNALGVITELNDQAIDLLGELKIPSPLVVICPEGARRNLESLVREAVPTSYLEQRLVGVAGEFDAKITLVTPADDERSGTLIAIIDVTAEVAARKQLERREADLRALVSAAPDPMAVNVDGEVVWANAAWSALLGDTLSRGGAFFGAVFEGQRQRLLALGGGSASKESLECRIRRTDGAELVLEVHAAPMPFRQMRGTLLMLRDLTERRRLEAQLAQADRVASIGTLVAGVAHEVNNPLAYIIANLDFLRRAAVADRPIEQDEHLQMLDDITRGAERIAGVVRELRRFHSEDDEVRELELNEMVVRALGLAENRAMHRVAFDRDLGRPGSVVCSPGRVVQVVLNLLLYLADTMPSDRDTSINRIEVRTWATETQAAIKVVGNNVGLTETERSAIFDPFFAPAVHDGGTGLGLSISNSLVRGMGGHIEVDSEVEEGTSFVVLLSRGELTEGASRTAPQAELTGDAGPMRVLIVDDEPSVRQTLRRIVQTLNGTAEVMASGNEAIATLEQGDTFDLILCDAVMRDGSGADVYRWLNLHRPELVAHLVIMTGMLHPGSEVPAQLPVLAKPFAFEQVQDVAQRYARRPSD